VGYFWHGLERSAVTFRSILAAPFVLGSIIFFAVGAVFAFAENKICGEEFDRALQAMN
jgi:hypothetical protein